MIELVGEISDNGKLSVYNQPLLTEWRLANTGKQIVLSLKVKHKTRSSKQNAYYWGVIVPMIREAINKFGNEFTHEETHEFLKSKFNAKQIELEDGHLLDMPQSTSKMDTREFMTFIENIQQFASMLLHINIPSPNEQVTIDYSLNQAK